MNRLIRQLSQEMYVHHKDVKLFTATKIMLHTYINISICWYKYLYQYYTYIIYAIALVMHWNFKDDIVHKKVCTESIAQHY